MNNILLVYPKPKFEKEPRFGFSIQLLQISSILRNKGLNVFYIDYSYMDYNKTGFISYLDENRIDAIIVEIDSFALKRSENCVNASELLEISKTKGIKTIAFGYDCIMDSKRIQYADHIITSCPFDNIPQILGVDMKGIDYNNYYDSLPYPDREILMTNPFFERNSTSTLIRTAEGCLNTCVFCQRRGWQNNYKKHSLEYVLDEFRYLKKHGYKNIWITDENFTFDLCRAKTILCKLIEENLTDGMKISISSWTNIDFEFLLLAKQANISIISMGIESANDTILDFYEKKVDLNHAKKLIEYADSIGIYMVGNFIIGAPMETIDTIDNTFSFISHSMLDQVNIKVLDYMIGSRLYESLEEKHEHHYFACSENGLCSFSLYDLTKLKNDFLKSFYIQNLDRLRRKITKFGVPYYPIKK